MEQPRADRLLAALEDRRRCLRNEPGHRRRDRREPERDQPDGTEADVALHDLADRRPNPQPHVQRQRQQVQRLTPAALRGEVGAGREDRHEEERLGDPKERAGDDEQRERVDEKVRDERAARHQGARDDQRPPTESIRRPTHHWPQHERPDGERAVRHPCPDLVRRQRAGRERCDDGQHDAAGHEEHE